MPNVPNGAAISLALIEKIIGRKMAKAQKANATSVVMSLDKYGARFGLDQPHRLAQFLAQIIHESGAFKYDREIWGPTPAQKRYDTRTDLGNTPAKDGDGKLRSGKGPLQLTGGFNEKAFTAWARKNIDLSAPDFYKTPDLINTDPWEGLSALWYWDTHNLNRYADQGDIEMITKRINGGLNGFADRLDWYAKAALVLLGFERNGIAAFQKRAGETVDGVAGPRTRAALHRALVALTEPVFHSPDVQDAPVVEEKTVEKQTVPTTVEEKARKTTNLWGWLTTVLGSGGAGITALFGADWKSILAFGGLAVGGIVILALVGPQIARSIRAIRQVAEG